MKCENVPHCPCENTDCENHSKCCICVKSHISKGYLPYCLRPKETEE